MIKKKKKITLDALSTMHEIPTKKDYVKNEFNVTDFFFFVLIPKN